MRHYCSVDLNNDKLARARLASDCLVETCLNILQKKS